MRNEEIIHDLFEAARNEPAARPLSSVEQLVKNAPVNTSSSLVFEWLKRNKMNMLISTSGIVITATILLFPGEEVIQENVIVEAKEIPTEQVEVTASEPEIEAIEEIEEPVEEANSVIVEKEEEMAEEPVEKVALQETEAVPQALVAKKREEEKVRPTFRTEQVQQKSSKVTEHLIVLESNKGKASVDMFGAYLTKNLPQLSHEFTSSATKREIKKFTLKFDNGHEADYRMRVQGFEKLELHWATDSDGELKEMWYRLDAKDRVDLDFSRSKKFSIKVTHKHEEF